MSVQEKAVTNDIQIEVESFFVPEQSDPVRGEYFFSYRIRIANQGTKTVQLLSRHWFITDGLGRLDEVQGDGVVGQQPRIAPGEIFEYESFCPLTTATGCMRGTYHMVCDDGSEFKAEIPQFYLVEPGSYH